MWIKKYVGDIHALINLETGARITLTAIPGGGLGIEFEYIAEKDTVFHRYEHFETLEAPARAFKAIEAALRAKGELVNI